MAVSSVNPVWDGRSGMIGEGGVRTYSQTFEVITTDELDTAYTILASGAVPRRFDAYPYDPYARCISVGTPSQSGESPLLWYFTAQYSTRFADQQGIATDPTKPGEAPTPTGDEQNPLARKPEISFQMHKYSEAMEKDYYGNAILNSANEKLEAQRDRGFLVITIKKNVPGFNWLLWRRLCYRTNSQPFMGIGVNKCRLADFDAHSRYENTVYFYEMTAKFECIDDTDDDTRTWNLEKLDAGYTYLEKTTTTFTGTLTAGSRAITSISSTSNFKVGDTVTCENNEFSPQVQAITSIDSSTQISVADQALSTGAVSTLKLVKTVRRVFTDGSGNPTPKPGLLNFLGNKLATGVSPHYIPITAYGSFDFNALQLLS